jgi:hypothetical protein
VRKSGGTGLQVSVGRKCELDEGMHAGEKHLAGTLQSLASGMELRALLGDRHVQSMTETGQACSLGEEEGSCARVGRHPKREHALLQEADG